MPKIGLLLRGQLVSTQSEEENTVKRLQLRAVRGTGGIGANDDVVRTGVVPQTLDDGSGVRLHRAREMIRAEQFFLPGRLSTARPFPAPIICPGPWGGSLVAPPLSVGGRRNQHSAGQGNPEGGP